MKKNIFILIFFFIVLFLGNIFLKNKRNQKHKQLVERHVLNKTLNLSKKERIQNEIPPNKYFEQKFLLEINPLTGKTHPENTYKVQQELKRKKTIHHRTPGDGIDNQWLERGPNNVGGRTRALLYDPNDTSHKRVFAGGVSGGLWVNDDITDVNSSWTKVAIDENLSVTCMAVDPNDSNILYLGTGELYVPQQALGNGIWKSTDGGVTWNNIYKLRAPTSAGIVSGTYYTTDIIVRDKDGSSLTSNDSEVFISVGATFFTINPRDTFVGINEYGIFKSTNGGNSFSRIELNVGGKSIAGNDFEIGLDNSLWLATTSNIFGAGGGRVYKSTDGISFSLEHSIANGRRTEISVSKQNANTLYVLSRIKTEDTESNLIAPFVTILKTTDSFDTLPTIVNLPNDTDINIPDNDFTRGQAFYNLMVEVDPTNDAIAYVGGIDLFRTTDSGVTWQQISKWSESGNLSTLNVSPVHSDQHIMVFNPLDSNSAIFGNDGGVYYGTNLSAAFNNATVINSRDKDYNTSQFYFGAISQTISPSLILGGMQDNGTHFFDDISNGINASQRINGGDGTQCFIDKDNLYMIVSSTENRIRRFDLPYTGAVTTIASDGETGDFFNAMALDDNLDILYSNGSSHLARFTNITSSSPLRTNITDPLLNDITAIKVSAFTLTSSKVFLGTRLGKVVKIENANTENPIITDISSPSFLGSISSISFGASEDEIMVTFYNFGVDSIWYTNDGGVNWSNKEGDFPDITVRSILMNPLNNDEVIIATELGVWNTSNFKDVSPNWHHSYNGMSNVAVTSLDIRKIDNTILATTFGRGLYTGKFKANNLTTWTGNTDSDWAKTNNWTNGLPTENVDVKIPNTVVKPILNTTAIVANMTIEKDAELMLNEQGALTINDDLTNRGELTINSSIANSGSLIVKGISTGDISYNRFVGVNWHLISAPVVNENYDDNWVIENKIASGSSNTNLRAIGRYTNNSGWQYMVNGETHPFTQGEGFTALRTSEGNFTFKGQLETGEIARTITKGTNNAFNSLGNVYASYIPLNFNADATHNFLTINSEALDELTIWLWDGSSYNAINQAVSSQFIAPGQAFFVKSKAEGASVLFKKEMQNHTNNIFLKKEKLRPEIRVSISNGKAKKYTDIFYLDTATTGFDTGFDSSLYPEEITNLKIFTTLVNQEKEMDLSIQSIPEDYSLVVPIGYLASENEEIHIEVSAKKILENKNVYLEDKQLGLFTLMDKEASIYKFINKKNNKVSDRFSIHVLSKTLNLITTDDLKGDVFYNDHKIFFTKQVAVNKNIAIYNAAGKLVFRDHLNEADFIPVDTFSRGVYIVVIATDKGVLKRKLFIE